MTESSSVDGDATGTAAQRKYEGATAEGARTDAVSEGAAETVTTLAGAKADGQAGRGGSVKDLSIEKTVGTTPANASVLWQESSF